MKPLHYTIDIYEDGMVLITEFSFIENHKTEKTGERWLLPSENDGMLDALKEAMT